MKNVIKTGFLVMGLMALVPVYGQQSEGISNRLTITPQPKTDVIVKRHNAPQKAASKNYAMLIGIDDYQDDAITPLSEPWNDANKLKAALVSGYTFEEADIKMMHNPSYEALHIAFEEMSAKVGDRDNILIFFAGHGYYDQQKDIGYWLPADARKSNRARWYRNSALVEDIGAINSKHTLLIADACFAGGIFKTREPFDNLDKNIANMIRKASRQAITSGALTEVPDKSVFMKYLLKTLKQNDKKYLLAEDLFYELVPAVKNNSQTRPLFGTIQNVGDEGGNYVFIKK